MKNTITILFTLFALTAFSQKDYNFQFSTYGKYEVETTKYKLDSLGKFNPVTTKDSAFVKVLVKKEGAELKILDIDPTSAKPPIFTGIVKLVSVNDGLEYETEKELIKLNPLMGWITVEIRDCTGPQVVNKKNCESVIHRFK